MAKKIKEDKQLIFVDNTSHRAITSKDFNFVLDKESGVSICWGETENDSPEYDPMTPQQLVISMSNFQLNTFIKNFNYLANVKNKIEKTKFLQITESDDVFNLQGLTPISTIASVVLIFNEPLDAYNFDDVVKFINYLKIFKISLIVQYNCDSLITDNDIEKFKLLSNNIIIKTSDKLDANIFNDNVKKLKSQEFNFSAKAFITKLSFKEFDKLLEIIPRDTAIKIYFDKPFITVKQYRDVQQKIIDLNLQSIRIATCFDKHFNKKTKNLVIMPMDCDACRFSLYVENNNVYPCEFYKSIQLPININEPLLSLWMNTKIKKVRKTIIENNFCNKKQRD